MAVEPPNHSALSRFESLPCGLLRRVYLRAETMYHAREMMVYVLDSDGRDDVLTQVFVLLREDRVPFASSSTSV